jgi:hypothetical protein
VVEYGQLEKSNVLKVEQIKTFILGMGNGIPDGNCGRATHERPILLVARSLFTHALPYLRHLYSDRQRTLAEGFNDMQRTVRCAAAQSTQHLFAGFGTADCARRFR